MTRQCELTRKNKILNERRHDYSNKAPESKKKHKPIVHGFRKLNVSKWWEMYI